MARQGNVNKGLFAQFLGGTAATRLQAGDHELLTTLAEEYRRRLQDAGLDPERPARQYLRGGLTPWLYYQVGTLALELLSDDSRLDTMSEAARTLAFPDALEAITEIAERLADGGRRVS